MAEASKKGCLPIVLTGLSLAGPAACIMVLFHEKVWEFFQWRTENTGVHAIVTEDLVLNAYPNGEAVYARLVLPGKGDGDMVLRGATPAGQHTTNDNYFTVLQPSDQTIRLTIDDAAGNNRLIIISPDMEGRNVTASISGQDCVLTVSTEGAPPLSITIVGGRNIQSLNLELAKGVSENPVFTNAAQAYRDVRFDIVTTMPLREFCPSNEVGFDSGADSNVVWTLQAPSSRLPMGDVFAQTRADSSNSPLMAFMLPAVLMVAWLSRGLPSLTERTAELPPEAQRARS